MIKSLYCDGSTPLKNPSPVGITYAFVAVDENDTEVYRSVSGITTSECGKFKASNNLAEMIAAVKALEFVVSRIEEADDVLILCSDSELTLNRLFENYSVKLLPKNVVVRANNALQFIQLSGVVLNKMLLAGHPTKKDLVNGYRDKKGKDGKVRRYPVSKWNVLVDQLCADEGERMVKEAEL